MRVLAVVPLPPPFTGPENATALLLEGKHPFNLSVVNTNHRRTPEARGVPGLAAALGLLRLKALLLARLLALRPRLVYYSITATRLGWVRDSIVILISRFFGSRVLLHFRGGHFGFFLSETDPLTRSVVKFCMRLSSGVIVQANRLAPVFAGLVRKTYVLPNPAPDLLLGPYPRPRRVLFVGHLSFAKGYATLLRAIPLVLANVPDASFVLVGWPKKRETNIFWNAATGERLVPDDPDEVFRREIEARGLSANLEFHRDIKGDEKARLFASCRVFVLPSYSEGFSVAMAEALSAGLPCVLTPVGAAPEVIADGHEGFFVQPGDHISLAEKIALLLKDDALAERMGLAARARAADLSPDKVRGKFHEIIRDAAGI